MIGVTERKAVNVAVTPQRGPQTPSVALPAFFRLKRWIDVVGSLVLIVLLFPLFLVAGVLVLLDVGRPILFWQERLGWKGRSFLIYKFRTLRAPFDAEGNPTLAGRRPSAIGRFLRATRLDELPQLLNVLLGDMSLVGPRPLPMRDFERLEDWHRKRYRVLPGITGLWQVSGRSELDFDDLVRLDFLYLERWSVLLDLSILLKTIPAVLSRKGAF